MPRYAASISEMLTMPVGVLTTDYIDVWCNTATDTPHKIRVGDMIAVKWNADVHDHEYTWCTVLATTHFASGAELTLMHEQAVDVPGHPNDEPTHVTYNWKVYTSDYRTKWMVYNFDNAAEHTEHVRRPRTPVAVAVALAVTDRRQGCQGWLVPAVAVRIPAVPG